MHIELKSGTIAVRVGVRGYKTGQQGFPQTCEVVSPLETSHMQSCCDMAGSAALGSKKQWSATHFCIIVLLRPVNAETKARIWTIFKLKSDLAAFPGSKKFCQVGFL